MTNKSTKQYTNFSNEAFMDELESVYQGFLKILLGNLKQLWRE